MTIKKIFLRTLLTESNLKNSLRRVIKKIDLEQYVSIQTKFMLNGNNYPSHSLGNKYFIDLKKDGDIEFYISEVLLDYNIYYNNKYDSTKITGIYIQCIKSNKDDYISFINKLNHENPYQRLIQSSN